MLANLNANHLRDLELFIDPFKETIESLTSEDAPNLQKVLPGKIAQILMNLILHIDYLYA